MTFADEFDELWFQHNKTTLDRKTISRKASSTLALNHPEYNWHLPSLSDHATLEHIKSIPFGITRIFNYWDFRRMSTNPNLTWSYVESLPSLCWDYVVMSSNHIITWQIVVDNPHITWDYHRLAANPNITLDIIKANSTLPWYSAIGRVGANGGVPKSFCTKPTPTRIRRNSTHFRIYTPIKGAIACGLIGENINTSFEDIMNNSKLYWLPEAVCRNPNITWRNVCDHPELNWDFQTLSSHPCVTFEVMMRNPNQKWDIDAFRNGPNGDRWGDAARKAYVRNQQRQVLSEKFTYVILKNIMRYLP